MGFETACESDTLCRWRTEDDPDAEPEAEAARLEARQVPTNFNVPPAQQRSLIAFGKALVLANTEALKLATTGSSVAPAEATTGSRLIAG